MPATGRYLVRAAAEFKDGKTGEDRQLLASEEFDRETLDLRARPEPLADISRCSGGTVFAPQGNDPKAMKTAVGRSRLARVEYRRTPLWDTWVWLTAMVGLLSVEWVVRRLQGRHYRKGDVFMLIPFYRIPLILICSYYCVVTSLFGALQFDGVVTYEGYARGKVGLTTKEQFSVTWDKGQYLIITKLLSTVPPFSKMEFWLPTSQQVGTDGEDLYYLKEFDNKTNRNIFGSVEPGVVPNALQSASVTLLWLAFGSGTLLRDSNMEELRPPWGYGDMKRERVKPTKVKINYQMMEENPLFLKSLNYLSPGTEYELFNKEKIKYKAPGPFSSGYTQAMFFVSEYQRYEGVPYPKTFIYEQYSPVIRSNRTFLDIRMKLSGTITSQVSSINRENWLPDLPDKRIPVSDKRFLDTVTNWDSVTYMITNQWLSRDDPNLQRQVNVYKKIAPIRGRGDSKKGNVVWIKVILIFAIVLPAVAYVIYAAKNRKRT